jgi:hypothetical protein
MEGRGKRKIWAIGERRKGKVERERGKIKGKGEREKRIGEKEIEVCERGQKKE